MTTKCALEITHSPFCLFSPDLVGFCFVWFESVPLEPTYSSAPEVIPNKASSVNCYNLKSNSHEVLFFFLTIVGYLDSK